MGVNYRFPERKSIKEKCEGLEIVGEIIPERFSFFMNWKEGETEFRLFINENTEQIHYSVDEEEVKKYFERDI